MHYTKTFEETIGREVSGIELNRTRQTFIEIVLRYEPESTFSR